MFQPAMLVCRSVTEAFEDSKYPRQVGYMGVSLNGGTPKTPQNDHF